MESRGWQKIRLGAGLGGFFLLTFFLLGFTSVAQALPAISCDEAWKSLPGNGRYNYQTDAAPSQKGNFGYKGYSGRVRRDQCYKPWTVLVYMEASDDLLPYALLNMAEMERRSPRPSDKELNGSTTQSDVIVQLEQVSKLSAKRFHVFEAPTPYHATLTEDQFRNRAEESIESPVIYQDSSAHISPQFKVASFLKWGMRWYPSKHYVLILWGHGEAWNSQQKSSLFLNIPLLKFALERLFGNRQTVDILVSDACVMQTVEVSFELAPFARFIIGSPQIQNYEGLPYRRIMHRINAKLNAKDDVEALAQAIVQVPRPGRAINMSSINSRKLQDSLVPTLYNLGDSLYSFLTETGGDFSVRTVKLRESIYNTKAYFGSFRDIEVFLVNLQRSVQEAEAYEGRASPASELVLKNIESVQQSLALTVFGTGLSAWLPRVPDEYQAGVRLLEQAAFFKRPWQKWLDEVYQRQIFLALK